MEQVTRLAASGVWPSYCCAAVETAGAQHAAGMLDLMVRAFGCCCRKKKKQMLSHLLLMERVTRLELATSTLARWRSTG